MPDAPVGVIAGGWSYVTAAYSITAAGLALYVWSVRRRLAAAAQPPQPSPADKEKR